MSIHFSDEQYRNLRNTYNRWWNGELDRPIVPIITYDHESDVKGGGVSLTFDTAWDLSVDVREYIEAHDALLSTYRWHGEAFPYMKTAAFGPGVLAAFLGCTPVGSPHTVWFMPPREDIPIEELHFEFDENNPCYRRVVNFYEAALEKWHGMVTVAMVDMGGILDVLQSFRGAENLLMDLYDSPEEVLRCVNEIQKMWFICYDKINAMLRPEVKGYSDWFGMYCGEPGYIMQSDFSYMIGPDMFDRFVAPELSSSGARMTNAIYHMDGMGQIAHLDSLLAIDGIKGIQWVPGAGYPDQQNWDEIVSRILDSGKKLVRHGRKPDGTPNDLAKNRLGQLYFEPAAYNARQIEEARRYAGMYGIEIKDC